jgi:hypothetical protein
MFYKIVFLLWFVKFSPKNLSAHFRFNFSRIWGYHNSEDLQWGLLGYDV